MTNPSHPRPHARPDKDALLKGQMIPRPTPDRRKMTNAMADILAQKSKLPKEAWQIGLPLIDELEGGSSLDGHWPGGNSGATFATGFDVGVHSHSELERLGLSPDLLKKIGKFANQTGIAARDALGKDLIVELTPAEGLELDQKVFTLKANQLADRFNNDRNNFSNTKFQELPPAAQAVLLSVAFNEGDIQSKAKNLWYNSLNGRWEHVALELEDWFDVSRSSKELTKMQRSIDRRRKKEAAVLRAHLGLKSPKPQSWHDEYGDPIPRPLPHPLRTDVPRPTPRPNQELDNTPISMEHPSAGDQVDD